MTLRRARDGLARLGHAAVGLVGSAWETVAWSNVRAGSISLAGTPRSFRLLMRLALWASIGLLIMLVFGDAWRLASPLLPLLFFTDSLSGVYAPQFFVPVIFGLLSLAWAYLLAGSLHAPWPAKLLVLALFALFDMSLTIGLTTGLVSDIGLLLTGLGGGAWTILALLVHGAAWLALLGVTAARWRRPLRLGLEFPLMLGLTTIMFFSSYLGTLLSNSQFQSEGVAAALQLTQTLQLIGVFLTPFLVMAGAEVSDLALQLTRQGAGVLGRARPLRQGAGRWLWALALGFFLCVRLLAQWLLPLLRGEGLPFRLGAAIIVAILLLVFFVTRGRVSGTALPVWVVPVAAVLLYGMLIVIQVIGLGEVVLAVGALMLGLDSNAVVGPVERFFDLLADNNEYLVTVAAWAIAAGLTLRAALRRERIPASAAYLGVFGLWLTWWVATRAGERLGALNFQYDHLAALTTPALLLALGALAAGRRLTARRLLYLTAGALLFWLLGFNALLSDPLSPLFGLLGAEAALLSVSIFLNVMAAGNRFGLNMESRTFPRAARGLLYFGYALLTVTTVNWLSVAHHVSAMSINDQVTQNGFFAIGLPLAFWAILIGSDELMGESPLADVDPEAR